MLGPDQFTRARGSEYEEFQCTRCSARNGLQLSDESRDLSIGESCMMDMRRNLVRRRQQICQVARPARGVVTFAQPRSCGVIKDGLKPLPHTTSGLGLGLPDWLKALQH